MRRLSSSRRQIISDHFYSVESLYQEPETMNSYFLWAPYIYLKQFFGPNDGVLLTESERFPKGFGHESAGFSKEITESW